MPHSSTTPPRWSLERVVAELRALHARGELGSTHELQQRGYGTLVAAAIRYAGSWGKAVRLAGAKYSPRRSWTEESVLREIRARHRNELSLNATDVLTDDLRLAAAARRYFGSWRAARTAAGARFGSFDRACRAAGLRSRS
jgi:hypothetical protein